ncbi:MAG: hypothetical protein INQ03_11175 [Candidatus Heimdallarchaeota archaeon]|nr:hypothetical protein [Candidatus Heimdallarchaeota archaeon]
MSEDSVNDELEMSLKISAKKLSVRIAEKVKELKHIEEEINQYDNTETRMEAEIEVHREKRDSYQKQARDMRNKKSELHDKKNALLDRKRGVQAGIMDGMTSEERGRLQKQINDLSDEIGAVFEEIDEVNQTIDSLYSKGQEEHEQMVESIENQKEWRRKDGKSILLSRKMQTERDLTAMRRRMKTLQDKIGN